MPNIENISVRSTTLKPNGILIGGATSNNGVLSFVANSYFEIPNGRQADATYVVKFTTPSANPSALKDILHIESWEAIEVTTAGKIYAWDFTNTVEVTLVSTMALNTTYWIKAVHSGTTKTYYLSTDGETFNQVASFNDTATDLNFNSPAVIGNGSRQNQIGTRFWTGTIDLNGCYIEVGGDVVWQGMDYNDIQRVGGDEFDGQWVVQNYTVNSSFTLSPGAYQTFSLASYLPNDGYDYEVVLENTAYTGTTSGDWAEVRAYTGTGLSGAYARLPRIRTRASANQRGTVTFIIPIFNADKNITIDTYSGSVNTCTLGLWARYYRRIGKNDTHSDYISAIDVGGSHYDINGKFLNGDWVASTTTLYNASLAGSGSASISLSSYLPNDGYGYEVLFNITARTGTTSGDTVLPRLGVLAGTSNAVICGHVTRTASEVICAGNVIIPVMGRTVNLYNASTATSPGVTVYARGYRRIGTNG